MLKGKSNTTFWGGGEMEWINKRYKQLDEVLAPLSGDFIVKLWVDDRCDIHKASSFYALY